MPILVLLFLVVPLLELYLLIQVGQVIGALPTIALCVLTAFAGGALLRQQGMETLTRARANLGRGQLPAIELLEGGAIALGGVLLLVPGFVTDIAGLICLIPPTRRLLLRAVFKRMHVSYGPAHRRPGAAPRRHETLEGDFKRRDRH